MSKLYDAVAGTQRSPGDRFIEAYNFFFTLICYGAIAASICFTFRNVRGSYRWFTLTDQNATLFFAGACLILSAVFFAILRVLGPVGHSSANIFWRFPGVVGLPKNPWRVTAVLIALIVWGLLGGATSNCFCPAFAQLATRNLSVAHTFWSVFSKWRARFAVAEELSPARSLGSLRLPDRFGFYRSSNRFSAEPDGERRHRMGVRVRCWQWVRGCVYGSHLPVRRKFWSLPRPFLPTGARLCCWRP